MAFGEYLAEMLSSHSLRGAELELRLRRSTQDYRVCGPFMDALGVTLHTFYLDVYSSSNPEQMVAMAGLGIRVFAETGQESFLFSPNSEQHIVSCLRLALEYLGDELDARGIIKQDNTTLLDNLVLEGCDIPEAVARLREYQLKSVGFGARAFYPCRGQQPLKLLN